RIGETTHADIGHAVDHALVNLRGLGQCAAGVKGDFYMAVRTLLDFLGPRLGGFALNMGRRKENAVRQFDGGSRSWSQLLLCRCGRLSRWFLRRSLRFGLLGAADNTNQREHRNSSQSKQMCSFHNM